MNKSIEEKIRSLIKLSNLDIKTVAKKLGITENMFETFLKEESLPSKYIFTLTKILNTSILYFYDNEKDIFSDIIESWKYNEKTSLYTSIPLVENIYPDNLLRTLYTSKTAVTLPFNSIKNFDSIIAVRLKKLNVKESILPERAIIVVNFKGEEYSKDSIVIAYNESLEWKIINKSLYEKELSSVYKIFGEIVFFELDELDLIWSL